MESLTVVISLPPPLPFSPLLPLFFCRQPSKLKTTRLPKPRSYTSRCYNIMYKSILPMVSYCRDASLTVNCFNVCWSVFKRWWWPTPRPPRDQRSKTDLCHRCFNCFIFFLSQNVQSVFHSYNFETNKIEVS